MGFVRRRGLGDIGDPGSGYHWDDGQGAYVSDTTGGIYTGSDPNGFLSHVPVAPNPLDSMSANDLNLFWSGQGADVQLPGWDATRQSNDPSGYAAALAEYKAANAPRIAQLTAQVQQWQTGVTATQNAATSQRDAQQILTDYLAYRHALDSQTGYTGPRLPLMPASDYTGPLDSATAAALRALVAALPADPDLPKPKSGPSTTTITSGGTVFTASDANIDPMISDDVVLQALDAVDSNGGDVTQPTAVVDQHSGMTVAVVQQLGGGDVQVSRPTTQNLGGIVNSVTGFIDHLAGQISNVSTQVKKIDNAVRGAATGAQAGYNAPTDWKPLAIGAGAIVGGIVLLKVLRKH